MRQTTTTTVMRERRGVGYEELFDLTVPCARYVFWSNVYSYVTRCYLISSSDMHVRVDFYRTFSRVYLH